MWGKIRSQHDGCTWFMDHRLSVCHDLDLDCFSDLKWDCNLFRWMNCPRCCIVTVFILPFCIDAEWNELLFHKLDHLSSVKGFDIESNPQEVIFYMGNFDITIIEKLVLVVQNVPTQIRGDFFVSEYQLILMYSFNLPQDF